MSLIHFKSVISCSSEDKIHLAKNLLDLDHDKKWLSAKGTEDRITCILEFDKASSISSIEIGNDGSAFIEILVSVGDDDWSLLLPVTGLMSPKESRSDINRNQKKIFQGSDFEANTLNKKWLRIKLICLQKFNTKTFGLQFIKLYTFSKDYDSASTTSKALSTSITKIDDKDDDETKQEQTKIGSYFAKIKAEKNAKSIDNDIHDKSLASSNVATELLKRKSINDSISSPPTKKIAPAVEHDQSTIMKNVVFVLSGFQNPLRSELRSKATAMGAVYNDDWDEDCTHLICAFPNTPKFVQVQKTGQGSIVNQQWILDCHNQKRLLPEKSYLLTGLEKGTPKKKKKESSSESEVDIEPEPKVTPKRKTPVKKKSISKKTEEKQGDLPDFFRGIRFYVSYGDFTEYTLLDIVRVILAYDGTIERKIDGDVDYVITKRMWNSDFEKIAKINPKVKFISIDWLQDCHDQNGLASEKEHLITPLA